ncbi:MAG: hypothetical protein ACLPXT_14135 [Terracidiphilus sp.]
MPLKTLQIIFNSIEINVSGKLSSLQLPTSRDSASENHREMPDFEREKEGVIYLKNCPKCLSVRPKFDAFALPG